MKEAECYAGIALDLKSLGCHDAATLIARKTLALVCPVLRSLQPTAIAAVASMLFSVLPDQLPAFVAAMQGADIAIICVMVVKVQQAAAARKFLLKEDANLMSAFSMLCRMVPPSIHEPSVSKLVGSVINVFVWLEDGSLLDELLMALVLLFRKTTGQPLLKPLVNDSSLWQQATFSSMGSRVVRRLTRERITRLANTPKPAFTWCQPLASLPHHPEVEAFLKGPLQSLHYFGLNDSKHARNFANKYFTGCYQHGYCAKGVVQGACCVITKTQAAYDKMVQSWNEEQKELEALRSRLKTIAESPEAKRPKREIIILD